MRRMRGRIRGVEGVWWSPRSSKPLRPDFVRLGGFDSHTLPPSHDARRRLGLGGALRLAAGLALGLLFLAPPAHSQTLEGTRAGVTRTDTLRGDPNVATDTFPKAPISPRRAFLYSLAIPGAGQAKLDRAYAGGLFILVEVAALTLVHRSAEDLRIARSFRDDSMPASYQRDPVSGIVARDSLGDPIVTAWESSRYSDAWVRTRRLHLEDWMALLIFNHLFSGADAFVAAQLWDLPAKVGLRQTPFGPGVAVTFSFGDRRR